MKIAIIGSGYVGLVSGACLADFGHTVTCIDKDAFKISALKRGDIPIFEPGLESLIVRNLQDERLTFTTDFAGPVGEADAVFIAVGTPSRRGDGHADLCHVYEAAREIAHALRGSTVVITKSTVPVGTGDEVERIIREECPHADFAVASNPEFLREGAAIQDFKHPDRIVIGVESDLARQVLMQVYRPLFLNKSPVLFTSRRSAELIKYAANAFLAMKITFINEIADLCEKVNADIQEVALGIGSDNRIGSKFLHAGPGFGGSCFPKDTVALIKSAQDYGSSVRLVETTVAINDARKRAMARRIIEAVGGNVRGKTIAIFGLTFKPNTDDMREAPSISIIQALQDAGAHIQAYDPKGMEQARMLWSDVAFRSNPYDAAENASAICILTEWEQFRALDFKRLAKLVATPIMLDFRNIYSADEVTSHGFAYFRIGAASRTGPAPTNVSPSEQEAVA
ncbi:UDP-glucose/GDP-mannose dehydrogenase family protein [Mesorhizobium sp. M00.F.Ca.ET.216.01.1.1]|uniref:UDP-glucose dehydrogenase family protein n=1 Tax=Mesorhizobium sp. M00.F.Ca.ET.216.01.1.1 TaxID=2500528 RepID=UPI000FD9128D|nr:UDP-glucose/GDP-mannose dehydrogenase family protein [Mesorhizobium sp. M00.F.Ca.ET.216.01.1.1]TGQ42030.1 UDP-glucose/GDP-mannose dehydrogenase family protein [Mesorhizobium sp. M00.F.Ca.ET.216.01.1.1]TJW14871.1 MAG: UDP-glucose/GDP-mannose dehydrogenase family protein [Mesorhizobium sp.]TJW48929.1 MAG: UDP-glucose/GDP-mannose dehydrogenase family protein [Mesorhizobium sp.]